MQTFKAEDTSAAAAQARAQQAEKDKAAADAFMKSLKAAAK